MSVYYRKQSLDTVRKDVKPLTPLSEIGRLLTILMILTGIALSPWQLGDWIQQLIKTANQIEMPCLGCGLPFHDKASLFCKICGTPLEQEPEEVL